MLAKSDQQRPAVGRAASYGLLFGARWGKRLRIRIIVCLVDRAEPAPLPKTSLKSDQARAKVVRVQRAYAHLGEVK
jgi:hypothetical protein